MAVLARALDFPLAVRPLPERDSLSDFPFQFNIAMGVRRRDKALRDSLNAVIDRKMPEIQAILKDFGVPLFPVKDEAGGGDDDGPPKKASGSQ